MTIKRGKQSLAFIFLFVVVLSAAFVSAGFFSDLWNRAASNSQQFSPYTCENIGSLADVNLDGKVNLIDMAFVKSKDGCNVSDYENCGRFDINGDGSVNLIDMALVKSLNGCVPQVQQFCVDTDGGKNYFTKGTLTNSSGTFDDKCEGLTGDGLSEQYCSGNISLTEYKSCYSLGNYYCSNGACVLNQTQNTCSDTDGGINFFNKGTVVYNYTNGTNGYNVDYCFFGNVIHEYYCDASNTARLIANTTCSSLGNYYCSNGACVLNQTATCTDTDGGKNYYVKGTLVNGNNTAVDYCSGANANGLIEFYCNGSSFIQDFLPSCTSLGNYMCQNGACILNQTNSSQII